MFHITSLEIEFHEIYSGDPTKIKQLIPERITKSLCQNDLEKSKVQEFLAQYHPDDPSYMLSYLNVTRHEHKRIIKSLRQMIFEEPRSPLTINDSRHIKSVFKGQKDLLPLWEEDFEVPLSEITKDPCCLKKYENHRAVISSNPIYFYFCGKGFTSCLDHKGRLNYLMGSVMNDRHHRLVMLLNPEGEIVARRFIRLGIITGQKKKEKRKALYFLKKLIPKEQLLILLKDLCNL